jgi:hypothetical protein
MLPVAKKQVYEHYFYKDRRSRSKFFSFSNLTL